MYVTAVKQINPTIISNHLFIVREKISLDLKGFLC